MEEEEEKNLKIKQFFVLFERKPTKKNPISPTLSLSLFP